MKPGWSTQGYMHYIMDNLIATGQVRAHACGDG